MGNLTVDPESLVSKIFKARYYPNGNYLTAKLGSNPSYVWRSLVEAQDLVRRGVGWRVRSGRQVSVLNDPWLLNEDDPYVRSRHPALEGCKVYNLMVDGRGEWDEDIIYDLFDEREAATIFAIPLCNDEGDDNIFWRGEKSGVYSVKSAYKLLSEGTDPRGRDETSIFWCKLWKTRVPPKVKNLLWRGAANCLPTMNQLRGKKIEVDPRCPQCSMVRETTMHCLVECPLAAACWAAAGFVNRRSDGMSFAGWLLALSKRLDNEGWCRAAVLCWALWRARNNKVWKNKRAVANEIVVSAKLELDQWRNAKEKGAFPPLTIPLSGDGAVHWSKPERNTIKVNVDAATFEDTNMFGAGWVARDSSGEVIEGSTKTLGGQVSPGVAEAVGVREALSWIKEKKWRNVTVETDCLVVVQSIRSSTSFCSYYGSIIDACKRLLCELDGVSLKFVKRSANRVAHLLARASPLLPDRSIVTGSLPVGILAIVQEEMSS